MFNYVVKDPDSSGLSREFWIKDQAGSIPKDGLPCVLELDCAVVFTDWPLGSRSLKAQLNLYAILITTRDVLARTF